MKKYRVIHLPTSVGGNPQGLSEHLGQLGIPSETWAFQQNAYEYTGVQSIWRTSDGTVKRELKRLRAIIRTAVCFDVIHFNYGSSWANPVELAGVHSDSVWKQIKWFFAQNYLQILSLAELNLYRLFGRQMFVHYQGDDARQGDVSKRIFSNSVAHHVDDQYYPAAADELKRVMIRRMSKYCRQEYSVNPDLMHVLGPNARFIPYAHISLLEWRPIYTQLEGRPLRIGHAPSHRRVKGTDFLLEALGDLAAEGIEFELVLIEGLPNGIARKKYEAIDVMIDQLHAGWYGGVAVEAMALGKPVMVYIRKTDLKFIPSEMEAELPFLPMSLETLCSDLRALLAMSREDLFSAAQKSRQFVEKWHDPRSIAKDVMQDYERALSKKREYL